MSEEENEKGFTVKDRRRFDASGNRREDATAEANERAASEQPRRPQPQPQRPPEPRGTPPQQPPRGSPPPPQQQARAPQMPQMPPAQQMPPDMDDDDGDGAPEEGEAGPLGFAEFVLSIATNAVIHMGGESKDGRVPTHVNLQLAAQHIDIIAMLAQKTRGNLSRDESELIEALLYDLRMKYVSVAQSQQRGR